MTRPHHQQPESTKHSTQHGIVERTLFTQHAAQTRPKPTWIAAVTLARDSLIFPPMQNTNPVKPWRDSKHKNVTQRTVHPCKPRTNHPKGQRSPLFCGACWCAAWQEIGVDLTAPRKGEIREGNTR